MRKVENWDILTYYTEAEHPEDQKVGFVIKMTKLKDKTIVFNFEEYDENEEVCTISSLVFNKSYPIMVARNGYFDARDSVGNIVHINFNDKNLLNIVEGPITAAVETMKAVQYWICKMN